MRKSTLLLGAAASLAACGQSANQAAGNASAPKTAPKKTPYCFFKDQETKGWSASTDAQGNVVVKGKAYRSDPRYKAQITAKVSGTSAEVRPTIVQNTTGYAAPDNWWDVSAVIPGSAAVQSVQVRCGKKVLADLKVPRKA
jgi:hypothetical protein